MLRRHVRADDGRARREKINVIPSRRERAASTAARRRAWRGRRAARASREVLGADGYDARRSPRQVVGNGSPVDIAADGRDRAAGSARRTPGARVVPLRPARVHRLAHVPRGVPGLRRLRLLPERHTTLYEIVAADPRARRAHRRARPRRSPRASTATSLELLGERAAVPETGCASAAWRSATGCSSTGRRLGRGDPCAATGRSRSPPGRKPRAPQRRSIASPAPRGVVRLGEAIVVIPLVKRALPRGEAAVRERRASSARPPRRASAGRCCARRLRGGARGPGARVGARRCCPRWSRCAAARSPPTTASSTRRSPPTSRTTTTPRDAAKEHDRCGSHLMAPMLAANLAGTALLRRAVERPSPLAGGLVSLASVGAAVEVFVWSERHAEHPHGPRAAAPGHELQRALGTREPDRRPSSRSGAPRWRRSCAPRARHLSTQTRRCAGRYCRC